MWPLLQGSLSPRSCPRSTRGGPAACAGTSTATRATTSARPRAWWSPWWRTSGTRGSCTRTARTCGSSTATPASSTRAWVRAGARGKRGPRGAPRSPCSRALHGAGRPALGEGGARVFSHQHLMIRIWIILYSSKPLYWAPSVGQILGKERTGRSSRPWTFSVCWGSSHQTELNYRQINALEGPFAESSAGTCHPDAKVPSLPGPSWHYFSLCQEVCPGHTASYELKPNVIRKDIDQGRKITEPRGVSAACAAEGEAGMRIAE